MIDVRLARRLASRYWVVASLLLAVGACCDDCPEPPDCRTGDCGATDGMRITFDGLEPTASPVVLFDGWLDDIWKNDQVCVGSPDVVLGHVHHSKCDPTELTAFTPGFGVRAQADCRGFGATLRLQLPMPDAIPVKVWVVGAGGAAVDVDSMARVHMERATRLYLATGAGLVFDYHVAAADGNAIGRSCADSDATRSSDFYDRDKGTINVYYIDAVAGQTPRAGESCGGASNLILISFEHARSRPHLLAHELGHALGLVAPGAGHIESLDPKPEGAWMYGNLMLGGINVADNITLGQLYRLRFDAQSWFYRNRRDALPFWRDCGLNPYEAKGPCPQLTTRVLRGWP